MAKKYQKTGATTKTNYKKDFNFKGGEHFQRMDYLLKLSNLLYSTHPNLANTFSWMMKDIKKRNALRMNSKFKKLICEKCNNFLYLDKNTQIELKNKNGKHIGQFTCKCCKNTSEIILF